MFFKKAEIISNPTPESNLSNALDYCEIDLADV